MNFRILAMTIALGFLSACAAPVDTAQEEAEKEEVASGPLAAVELRDGKAVPVDADGNVIKATLTEIFAILPDRVLFDYNRFNIRTDAEKNTVDIYAALMNEYPDITMAIEGHADERGTREYNLALGERRADSIYSRVISQGIVSGRIQKTSYGKERPEALGSNEAAWAKNRRGVILMFNF